MRVLFVNGVVDYGSTGKIVRDLADGLKDQGHDVSMVFGRHQAHELQNTVDVSSKLGFYHHYFGSRILGKHGQYSKRATKQTIQEIERFKPDVIHLHNLHGYYLHVPNLLKYLAKAGIPVIWTLHDCWMISGSAAYFDYYGCDVWDQGCQKCHNTKEYPINQFGLHQIQNLKWKQELVSQLSQLEVITVSNWLNELISSTFFQKHQIHTIYNGINENVFTPSPKSQSTQIKLLGVANEWEKRKGLDDFIALNEKLDDRYEITLIGLSEAQVAALPSDMVGITRTKDQKELAQYYSDADIYLNLSVEETMGLTTIESLACGTPVITYNKTAVPELVDESVGLVVEAHDLNALQEAITKVYESDTYKTETLVDYAHRFTNDIMISNYLKIYNKYQVD